MKRIDVIIKEKYNFSREYSKELILNGKVKADGKVIFKPGLKIDEYSEIKIDKDSYMKYVGRGGLKFEDAIKKFNLDLKGKICIDVGASTGGFTDCMLQNGAKKVYAIDVGSNQLSEKLKNDKRVIPIENTNIKNISKDCIDEDISFASVDVSFISITKVLPYIKNIIKKDAEIVALVKPQFEAGKENINKNGIVKNPKVHIKVLNKIYDFCNDNGFYMLNMSYSPIKGSSGNIEYFIYIKNNINLTNDNFRNVINEIVKKSHDRLN